MSRILVWSLIFGLALAALVVTLRGGHLQYWRHWLAQWGSAGEEYSEIRFRVDLVDRLNYSRIAAKRSLLKVDGELDEWLQRSFPQMVLDDIQSVTNQVQDAMPHYYRLSVCVVSAPSLKAALDQFQDFREQNQPDMTHLGCAVRTQSAGFTKQVLLVIGRRLHEFTPENLTLAHDEAYFSRCRHCKHPHIVKAVKKRHSLGLECPQCRRTYAVVASDEEGVFRYANEFLTGYAPPAVFSKDQSRVHELFTIWTAVHEGCTYVKDPIEEKTATDAWQTSLETQRLGRGDCEDSAIFLCDWLLARGFQARVALGRYGDLGGHAWVVVKLDDKEYLLESTEGRPDPSNPPLVTRVGSRYIPEVMFDRHALFVRSTPGQGWKGDYWSSSYWTRIEPRSLDARQEGEGKDAKRMARTHRPDPAVAPFQELEEIPRDSAVWRMNSQVGNEIPPASR